MRLCHLSFLLNGKYENCWMGKKKIHSHYWSGRCAIWLANLKHGRRCCCCRGLQGLVVRRKPILFVRTGWYSTTTTTITSRVHRRLKTAFPTLPNDILARRHSIGLSARRIWADYLSLIGLERLHHGCLYLYRCRLWGWWCFTSYRLLRHKRWLSLRWRANVLTRLANARAAVNVFVLRLCVQRPKVEILFVFKCTTQ